MKIKIKNGHTNISYKNQNKFLQIKIKNGLNHKTDYNVLKSFDFVPKLLKNGDNESIWEWIEGEELHNPTNEDLINLAKILLTLHNSKIKLAPFNIKERIISYRKIMNQKKIKIDIIDKMYKKINLILRNMYKTTPIHADLWQSNILKNKSNKLFLVDWEYSHMGDHHFELAYIIESFKMNKDQERLFLEAYDDYNPSFLNKHKALVHYLTILWIHAQEKMPFNDQESIEKLTLLEKNGI